MFRKEKTVPNMSFASSSALSAALACGPPLTIAWEDGLELRPEEEAEGGIQRLL